MRHQRFAIVIEEGVFLVLEVDAYLVGDVGEEPCRREPRISPTADGIALREGQNPIDSEIRENLIAPIRPDHSQRIDLGGLAESEMQAGIDG